MKDLMAEAQRAGLPVRSTIARANQTSVHFYRNLGFELTGQDAAYVRIAARQLRSGASEQAAKLGAGDFLHDGRHV